MGGNATQNMIPTERRSFQITRTSPISITGTVNTGVFDFDDPPVNKWGSQFPFSVLNQVPAPLSGTWVNVVRSATLGTCIKFLRRGMYRFDVALNAPAIADVNPLVVAALILDGSTTSMGVGAALLPTTLNARNEPGVIAWSLGQQGTTRAFTLNFGGEVPITDALAAYDANAMPANVAGQTGIGCVRLHVNNGAGGALSLAAIICSLWCNYIGDLAG